jgi:predicted kinase
VSVGKSGYRVAYAVAEDNLRLSHTVIADSVNPLEIMRSAWRNVAKRVGTTWVEIEVVCSNEAEHRHRIEPRSAPTPVTCHKVVTCDFEPWAGDHIRIDTAGQPIDHSLAALRAMFDAQLGC